MTFEILSTPVNSPASLIFQQCLAEVDPENRSLTSAMNEVVVGAHEGWIEGTTDSPAYKELDMSKRSSILFDCVAVYLCFSSEWMKMEELPVLVTEDGKTVIDECGSQVNCAMDWVDKEKFLDLLTERLLAEGEIN